MSLLGGYDGWLSVCTECITEHTINHDVSLLITSGMPGSSPVLRHVASEPVTSTEIHASLWQEAEGFLFK